MYCTIYSRVGPVILGPAESAMPWVYCYLPIKAIANGPFGQVLARPLFLKIPFYKKQVINKSTRVIFGPVQLACYIMMQ